MTEAHTPGPWHYHYDADGDHVILSGDGVIVAVTGGDGYVERPIDEANARVLAAAPEMLEALNEFLAYSECHCTCGASDCTFCLAEAVVHKAEGSPHNGKKSLERMAFCLYNVGRCPAVNANDKHSEECEQLWTERGGN